jgi:16S rRNA (guanine966-N2)-methyltransferase
MRITSGVAKGYKLKVPTGDRVKPAQSIVRQAIFNMLGESIVGARVLDLFAGSGSLGIEALSRGAAWVDFVDRDKKVTPVIKHNLLHTNFEEKAKVYTTKAERFLDETIDTYDFIFLSPPYAQGIDRELLQKLPKVLRNGGLVVFEHAKETTLPENLADLTLLDQRTYGAATVSFLQKSEKK